MLFKMPEGNKKTLRTAIEHLIITKRKLKYSREEVIKATLPKIRKKKGRLLVLVHFALFIMFPLRLFVTLIANLINDIHIVVM